MSSYAKFENIEREILRLLGSANKSILICVAWLSRDRYAPTLRALAANGVSVTIVCNDDTHNLETIRDMKDFAAVYPIKVPRGFMHNKFCIIDDRILISGSYNWSYSAQYSYENITISIDEHRLTKQFLHEFWDLVDHHKDWRAYLAPLCNQCPPHFRVPIYVLGVIGQEEGEYSEAKIGLWEVCKRENHAHLHSSFYHQDLFSQLGYKEDAEPEDSACNDVYSMRWTFEREREAISRRQNYFDKISDIRVDAFGMIGSALRSVVSKYESNEEIAINIDWRRKGFRRIIPEQLYEDGAGISRIIHQHRRSV
ncbi:phospholipase D-like domain-containing protein [Azospirillum sp. SYSU D00513]|uniref:phospholipase D-like domain-containing protein n=1 Tax=Azospirillum sp. SYSU D00513 TaxID=2812561 RepID=UPI001A95EC6F|nr:phospholipase D-like domain-containing protein [Azospirillum sp. SYSU D00513]